MDPSAIFTGPAPHLQSLFASPHFQMRLIFHMTSWGLLGKRMQIPPPSREVPGTSTPRSPSYQYAQIHISSSNLTLFTIILPIHLVKTRARREKKRKYQPNPLQIPRGPNYKDSTLVQHPNGEAIKKPTKVNE